MACRAKALEAFAPYATDIFFGTIPEGGNNVAIAFNVHDMEGLVAATATPEHQAFIEEAGISHPPHAMYFEAVGQRVRHEKAIPAHPTLCRGKKGLTITLPLDR